MKKQNIYQRALNSGAFLESTCVSLSAIEWDMCMKGARRANQKKVVKIALLAGVIGEEQAKRELKYRTYNPYTHYITKDRIIYCHSGIEHFIKINE